MAPIIHTLESMHELAVLYKEQGDYDKAEPLLIQAIEGRRLKLGDNHPHTQESLKNLIALYEVWNKPKKAEQWRAKLPQTEAVEERHCSFFRSRKTPSLYGDIMSPF